MSESGQKATSADDQKKFAVPLRARDHFTRRLASAAAVSASLRSPEISIRMFAL